MGKFEKEFFDHSEKELIRKKTLSEIKQLKDEKGFLMAGLERIDHSSRLDRLFGRDSLISAWQLLDFMPDIAKSTLEILSQYQGKVFNNEREEEPGRIINETDFKKSHHYKYFFPYPHYGSIDSTLLFLNLFSFYYKKTEDIGFLNDHWENILKALNWIEQYGDKDKDLFLEYESKNPKSLFHQGWKDFPSDNFKIEPPVAVVEAQGYQHLALKETAQLAIIKNDRALVNKLEDRACKLKKKFNQDFWMEDKKFFAFALDGKKQQIKTITSNPGQLLFTGILEEEKIDFVVKRLVENDLWTPFGVRTHSASELDFDPRSYHLGSVWPHDNWIIAQGLKKLGYENEYQKVKNAILTARRKIGYLPEYYGVSDDKITLTDLKKAPCYPQAWSSGALLNFLHDS